MHAQSNRFLLTILLAASGISLTVFFVNRLSEFLYAQKPTYDLIPAVSGTTPSDAQFLLMVVIPLYLVEFLILTIPLASLMLIGNKLVKSTAYTQSVMKLGTKFGAYRMVRRAAMPALFALSFGDLLLSLVGNWPFEPIPLVNVQFEHTVINPLLSILSSLVVLPVALAIFMPTWALDDSGIVTHLKPEQLDNRRPPHTEGVGRWYSSYISGFALLGFPIAMVYTYFYVPFFVRGVPMTSGNLTLGLLTTIGVPLLLMSFVLPVIMLNEIIMKWMSRAVQGISRRLGAQDVPLERVVPGQTTGSPH